MAFKVFLDANILLDFTLKRAEYQQSKLLMTMIVNGSIIGVITPPIVHILGYWLSKEYGSKTTKEILLNLLVDINVIDISHPITMMALQGKINDIEDAIQYFTALHHKLDYFLTRDVKLIKERSAILPIISPQNFIKLH